MANIFKNIVLGNLNRADYTEKDQPKNRKELFKTVLMVRKGELVTLNFFYLLSWIPALLWTMLNYIQLGQLQGESLEEALASLLFTWLIVLCPLRLLTGMFRVGVGYVTRNWARDEHSTVFRDGFSAIKRNLKQGLLLGLMDGLMPLIVFVCGRFYIGMAQDNALFYLPLALTAIIGLMYALFTPILPMMMVTYKLGLAGLLRNAAIMTLATLPRAVGLRLLTLAMPVILLFCGWVAPALMRWVFPITILAYALIVPALNQLIWASHANAVCEKYINPKIRGAQVDIGLYSSSEEIK